MFSLEYFYNTKPKIESYKERKIQLPDSSFNLYGARGVGKSALVIDYLSKLPKDSYLYIDAQDPIFILEDLESYQIEEFLKNENINTLIIDHYYDGFLDRLPNVDRLIVVSKEKVNYKLNSIKLYPLDFEEFFNFQKTTTSNLTFSLYNKFGSLPHIAISHNLLSFKELFFEKFDIQEGKVLLILSLFNGKISTPHQIYQKAKEYFKISKDWLYRAIDRFSNEGIIYQIETIEKGFGKKIYLYDFALAKYLNKRLNFNNIFESIVALALIKKGVEFKSWSNRPYFICEDNRLIIVAPFIDEDTLWSTVQKEFSFYSNLNLNNVTIVTNSNSFRFNIKNINFEAIPFYEWANIIK